ncbi:MAG TPA: diacylglycerol kinase [Thermodesulfovibrionales bacterium]|nr:diacylglycerol kinase [Thermodesulfovibrionales bacterium]
MKRWIKSANCAIEGILHGTKTQRHVRYHLYSASFILVLSYVLGVSKNDFLVIGLAVIVVLVAELFNTAIETVVDLISPEHSVQAKIAKDVAAGAVLITAFGAAVMGYIVLLPYIRNSIERGFHIARHSGDEISIMAVILVMILVVITKAYFGKGTPLRGGLPSGHAALAFSVWVTVTYTTDSSLASLLCFMLAAIIAGSRVTSRIHTTWEVIIGGLMGASMTFLLFHVFS